MKKAKKTQWLGLWNNRQAVYSGQVLNKADIPAYARLIVRYNKYYEAGGNKPRFVYCFAEGEAADAITIETTAEEYLSLEEAEEQIEKIERLAEIMRRGNSNADIMRLPSESIGAANDLMAEAISLIEEITGEKWDFSYLTF